MTGGILLVNPNTLKPAVGPIGLDYLADLLRERGIGARLLDLCFETDALSALDRALAREEPLLVGISLRNTDDCYMASAEDFVPALSKLVDQVRRRTGAPVAIGGAGFSVFPEEILDTTGAEFGITGDGEVPLAALSEKISNRADPSDVPGLVWRDGGKWRRNPPWSGDPSTLPARGRSLIDDGRYLREGGQCGIETKRGCDRRCIYCAETVSKGRRPRVRSPSQAADEFELLAARGIDHFHLCDSEFNVPVWHAREVCRELANRGLGDRVRWYTYATPAGFDDELAAQMRAAGCAGVNFGADAGDARMLEALGRDFGVADLEATERACRKAGLTCMFDLLLGGPGETRESIQHSIEEMKRISPDRVGISQGVRVYPGTRLAAMVRAAGPLESNPNLRGPLRDNASLLRPVHYLSAELGDDAAQYTADLVGGDERFFFPTPDAGTEAYNYSGNDRLVEAIRRGHRGAYWDILRRLEEEEQWKKGAEGRHDRPSDG
jgi:radical SAM superfamily enzyme YgiQ (UPF0313 family)